MSDARIVKPLPVEDLDHILSHTRELWTEAKNASFFITGGTGFFGIWLLESFAYINDQLGLGMSATVLTRDPRRFAVKNPHLAQRKDLHFVPGDVRSFDFPPDEFRYVVHGATTFGVPVDHLEMLETIIDGTRRVLDFASKHGAQKFLYISSGAVYGKQPDDLSHIPEDYRSAPNPLDPKSVYGEGKRVGELLSVLKSQEAGFEAKIARCFAFIGPRLPLGAHFAGGNFIRDAVAGGPIVVNGDGKSVRSYLYSSDLAIWLWTILFSGRPSAAFNVGSEREISILELATLVADVLVHGASVKIAGYDSPSPANSRYVPDCRRARTDLHLCEYVDLQKAIKKTSEWISSTP
jgi:nucleoside-diphosphate-sugar epimerase